MNTVSHHFAASDLVEYNTKTGDWSLAIHRVSTTTAEVWFGSLCATVQEPSKARLVLETDSGELVATHVIEQSAWQRPFKRLKQRFYALHCFTGLQPNQRYLVRFDRYLSEWIQDKMAIEDASFDQLKNIAWQDVCSGQFTTLPVSLPRKGEGAFTVGLASCYFRHRDEGRAAAAYKKLYFQGLEECRPAITFFAGDQVYLDIGLDSLSFRSRDIWERIANEYENQWKALGEFLRCGGTWMLPDDHEFWNDYPFYRTLIPTLWPLHKDSVRRAWKAASQEGVDNIQRSPRVETFTVGDQLSFCLFDSRSKRHKRGFTDEPSLVKIEQWASELTTPGVLVGSQNLIDKPGGMEKNLVDFTAQYDRLMDALATSGHDIVSLSGDVHFGRIASVSLGDKGGILTEVVASPLSNLTGLNGIATATASDSPKRLTWRNAQGEVDYYQEDYFVGTEPPQALTSYPKQRTREHLMTVGFARMPAGRVEMRVDAWRVREEDEQGLPVADFKKPFIQILQ